MNSWRKALVGERKALMAERRDGGKASATLVQDHANNIGGALAEITLAERSNGVVAVGAPVSAVRPDGTRVESDADVVAEGGRVWKDSKNYGLFGIGSAKTAELLSQALRQLEILAYNLDYRDANGHPPSLQWNFPRGVTPEVAAALEGLRVTDPRTGEVVVDPRTGQPLQLTVTQDGAPPPPLSPAARPARLRPAATRRPSRPGRERAGLACVRPRPRARVGRDGNDDTVGDRAAMANIAPPSGVPKLFRFVIKGVLGAGVPGFAAGTAAFLAAAYSGNVAAQLGAAIAGVAAVVSSVAASIAEWKFERIKENAAATPTDPSAAPELSATQQDLVQQIDTRLDSAEQTLARREADAARLASRTDADSAMRRLGANLFGGPTRTDDPQPATRADTDDRSDTNTVDEGSSAKLPSGWAFVLKAGAGPAVTAAVVGVGVWVSGAAATLLAAPVAAVAALASFAAWTESRYQRYKATLSDARSDAVSARAQARFDAAMQPLLDREAAQHAREREQQHRARALADVAVTIVESATAGRPVRASAGFAALFDPTPSDDTGPDTSGRVDPTPTAIPSAVPGVHRVVLKSLLASGVPGMTAAAAAGWAAFAAGNAAGPAAAVVVGTVAAVGSVLSGAGDWVYDRLTERLENLKHAQSELDRELSADQQRVIAATQALLDQNDQRLDARDAWLDQRAERLREVSRHQSARQDRGVLRRTFAALVSAGSRPAIDPAPALPTVPDPVRPGRGTDDQSTDDRADTAAVTVDYAAKLPRGWAFFLKAGLGAIGGIAAGVVAATVAGVPFLMLAGPTAAAAGATVLGALAERWFQRRKLDASEAKKAVESRQSEDESVALLDQYLDEMADRAATLNTASARSTRRTRPSTTPPSPLPPGSPAFCVARSRRRTRARHPTAGSGPTPGARRNPAAPQRPAAFPSPAAHQRRAAFPSPAAPQRRAAFPSPAAHQRRAAPQRPAAFPSPAAPQRPAAFLSLAVRRCRLTGSVLLSPPRWPNPGCCRTPCPCWMVRCGSRVPVLSRSSSGSLRCPRFRACRTSRCRPCT